mmetsp:Transcript_3614/g.8974  ORF Transcript_3614/g.8974 Transcript_3614/m.8974 type:complete len:207 (-) Transcript_3614:112-732(-)
MWGRSLPLIGRAGMSTVRGARGATGPMPILPGFGAIAPVGAGPVTAATPSARSASSTHPHELKPWFQDRAERPEFCRAELTQVLGQNVYQKIDWGKEEDFLTELRRSPFAASGPMHRRQLFEAEVVETDEAGVHADYGGKFNVRVTVAPRRKKRSEIPSLKVGDRIVIELRSPEATDHMLGDSKHVSIFTATGFYVGKAATPPGSS